MEMYREGVNTLVFYQKPGDEKYSFLIKHNEELTEQILGEVKQNRVRKSEIKYAADAIFELIKNGITTNSPKDVDNNGVSHKTNLLGLPVLTPRNEHEQFYTVNSDGSATIGNLKINNICNDGSHIRDTRSWVVVNKIGDLYIDDCNEAELSGDNDIVKYKLAKNAQSIAAFIRNNAGLIKSVWVQRAVFRNIIEVIKQ